MERNEEGNQEGNDSGVIKKSSRRGRRLFNPQRKRLQEGQQRDPAGNRERNQNPAKPSVGGRSGGANFLRARTPPTSVTCPARRKRS